ncbi:MAG: nucleotidyltransferase family protein [Planctomycetales bacterium]|nr:nucleotidyltransferase family protein [Planctomycetales bacterium]
MKSSSSNAATQIEDELLNCCARVSASQAVRQRLDELLRQPIQWQRVLDRSWWHRIRPLTYYHLREQPTSVVPTAFLEVLARQAHELEQRNVQLMKMQRHVASLFEQASIPMLVFKGPTLATDAYGDLSLRECGDLDMLIRPDDFPRLKEVLKSEGFSCLWDEIDSDRKRQLFACEFRRDGVELDIHWDLAPAWHNYRVDFDQLWASGNPFDSGSSYSRKLRGEDLLEVLCMHGTRHWWERLRWICDIAELVNSGHIADWKHLERQSTESRCHRSVLLGLWLAGNLLDAKLPREIRSELESLPVVQRLGDQVGVWLEKAEHAADVRKLPDRFMFRMRLCERWRDRLPQIAHYLVTLPSRSVNWNP